MPFLNSVEFNFAYSSNQRPQVSTSALFLDLAAFGTWHRQNGFKYYNSISSFFYYGFDGTSNTISDGGFDMWDGGNCNSIFGTFTSTNLVYGTSFNDNLNKRGYYVSPPGNSAYGNSCNQPFICLGYVNSGTITWNNAGDIGTDGGAAISSNINGSYTAASNRSGVWYANQNYNGGDPNICYLWFTVSQPTFSNILTNTVDGRKPFSTAPPNTYNSSFMTFIGSNLIIGQFLLSRYPTGFITPGEISTFLLRYISEAPLTVSP